jgi:hypothetical protein
MRRRGLLLTAFLYLAGACGDSGAPSESLSLAGTWTYAVPTITGAGFDGSCEMTANQFTLTQSGDSIHGVTETTSQMICTPSGGDPEVMFIAPPGVHIDGALSGSSFGFYFGGAFLNNTGRASQNRMLACCTTTRRSGRR